MKRLYFVTLMFVALEMPTLSQAANNTEDKDSHRFGLFASSLSNFDSHEIDLNDYSHVATRRAFNENAIIKNAVPSFGSFQEVSARNLSWLTESSDSENKNSHFEGDHSNSLIGEDQHGESHENSQLGHGHEGRGGEFFMHDKDDEHMTQPVPEPSSYMLMLLGVMGLGFLNRRQF